MELKTLIAKAEKMIDAESDLDFVTESVIYGVEDREELQTVIEALEKDNYTQLATALRCQFVSSLMTALTSENQKKVMEFTVILYTRQKS